MTIIAYADTGILSIRPTYTSTQHTEAEACHTCTEVHAYIQKLIERTEWKLSPGRVHSEKWKNWKFDFFLEISYYFCMDFAFFKRCSSDSRKYPKDEFGLFRSHPSAFFTTFSQFGHFWKSSNLLSLMMYNIHETKRFRRNRRKV